MWSGKSYRAVLCLGCQGIAVALREGKSTQIKSAEMFSSPEPLSVDSLELIEKLVETVQIWLREQVGNAFLELSVYLADPLVAHHVLELDAWPTSRRAQGELVRWRIAEESGADKDSLSVVWEVFPQVSTQAVNVHVMALPPSLQETIVCGFRAHGWPVLVLTSQTIGLREYGSPQPLARDEEKVLELAVGNDYWLARHSEAGAVSHIRCRWFGQDDQALEREIARSLNVDGVGSVQLISFEKGNKKAIEVREQLTSMLGPESLGYQQLLSDEYDDSPALQQFASLMVGVA